MTATRTTRGRRRRLTAVPAVAAAAALLLAGCTSDEPEAEPAPPIPPRAPAPVELAVDLGGEPVQIGVLLAVTTPVGQGQDVLPGAQGAAVAAYRLGLDTEQSPVELRVATDDGTPQGAEDAMAELVDAGVAGVVVASTGDHLTDAVDAAVEADTPVLLPYWRPAGGAPEGAWLTGPSADATDTALRNALDAVGSSSPFLVSGDGITAEVDAPNDSIFRGNNPAKLVRRIATLERRGEVDGVVLAAAADTQARLVGLFQGEQPDLPIVLTPEALSPVFADRLTEVGGTTSGRFTTVGPDAGDATTLAASQRGDGAASYFAALRLASGDEATTDLLGEQPFADVAAGADIPSHDAVVALARAAGEAGSTEPAAVRDALATLSLGPADGLAGAPLDFASAEALDAGDVVVLNATTQDPGVRPQPAGLYWFAVDPAAEVG